MTEYEQIVVHKIEVHTFDITRSLSDLLAELETERFEEASSVVVALNFHVLEIIRLHRKLLKDEDL